MKKRDDPRHVNRVAVMQTLFEKSFNSKLKIKKGTEADQILSCQEKIDKLIKKNAPAWPISQILPLDMAILRLAIWELLYKTKKEPYRAVVDEAVEIAKEYGADASASFVNGVLGAIIKSKPAIND